MSLKFIGSKCFRQRIVFSLLCNRSIKIEEIRAKDINPGLREFEVSFLRLIDSLTNGSIIEISYTGTSLFFKPGQIIGGTIEHECHVSRSIGYYLEPLLSIVIWGKQPLTLILRGVTSNSDYDSSVDVLRTSVLPILYRQLNLEELELKILKRGSFPDGGGEVVFVNPNIKSSIDPINFIEANKVKKIRGIAYSTRVPPNISKRLVESSRSILNQFIPDIYIYTDVRHGPESGKSPGWGISLVAESDNTSWFAEQIGGANLVAEDIGISCANQLLNTLSDQCVSNMCLFYNLIISMVLASNTSQISFSPSLLNLDSIQLLRDIKTFFNVKGHIDNNILSICGLGYRNPNRALKQ